MKKNNLSTVGVPKGKEREKGAENLFKEIIAEIFPSVKRFRHPSF